MNAPLFLAFLPHGLDFFWIFIVFVLLFGAKKIPELARGLGKGLGEFKKAKSEFDQELQASMKEAPPAVSKPVDPAALPKPGEPGIVPPPSQN